MVTASLLTNAASAYANAAVVAAPVPLVCPVKHPVPQKDLTDVPESINSEMQKRFLAVSKAAERKGNKSGTVDPALMSALAEIAGCGALLDRESSCSMYYSPIVGDPLALIMARKKSDPLRKQFEAAIKTLPNKYEREAAQYCIKLTGAK
jgi:hypothetical protein